MGARMNVETSLATLFCATLVLIGTTGCKPDTSPKGVCDHMAKLAKDAGEDGVKVSDCVKQLEELEKQDAKAYGEFASCSVDAKDFEAAGKCMEKMIAAQMAGK